MRIKLIATLAAAVALSGCATKPAPTVQAVDLQNEGIAKTCTPSIVDLATPAPATITMTNDGWCGVFATEKDGQAFKLGLLPIRSAHGRVFIQKVNDRTRIEYTPEAGYVGADTFTVALVSRTAGTPDTRLRVDVAVAPGDRLAGITPAAVPAPAPARRPTATTPRRPAAPAQAPARRPAAPAR